MSSYGPAKESSGMVQLLGDIPANLAGRPVLLVDDIVDTAENDRLCGRPTAPIDFVGFSIGDVFAVGYGTDYAEKNRHLPYIGAADEIQQFDVAHRSATPQTSVRPPFKPIDRI